MSKDATCEKTEGKVLATGSMGTGKAKFSVDSVYKHIILNHLGVGKGANASRVGISSKRNDATCEKAEGKELAFGSIGMGKGKELTTGSMVHHEETRELVPNSSTSALLALSDGMQVNMQTETSEWAPGTIGMGTGKELATGSMDHHAETRELVPSSLVSKLLALSDDMAH